MHPNIEQCLPCLAVFADSLGWIDLVDHHHVVDGTDVVWYTSGTNDGDPDDFFLQINESPSGSTAEFAGAVYAVRYKLWTGWHRFPFPGPGDALRDAIAKTDAWLNNKWFTEDGLRLQFSNQHPECTGFDWQRIRESPPPHES